MTAEYSEHIEKIVNNYVHRLKRHLKGFPEIDQQEMIKEIQSHIYESYIQDPAENEIERIFNVLDKLGEPAEVVSTRMSSSMVKLGKRRKLPFYILAGLLIGLFGIPLGLGGLAVLLGILITVLVFVFAYYFIAVCFIIIGWLGAIASIIRILDPYFLEEYIHLGELTLDPMLNGIINVAVCLLLAAIGIGLLWFGRYLMQGLKFLFQLPGAKLRDRRRRKRLTKEAE